MPQAVNRSNPIRRAHDIQLFRSPKRNRSCQMRLTTRPPRVLKKSNAARADRDAAQNSLSFVWPSEIVLSFVGSLEFTRSLPLAVLTSFLRESHSQYAWHHFKRSRQAADDFPV